MDEKLFDNHNFQIFFLSRCSIFWQVTRWKYGIALAITLNTLFRPYRQRDINWVYLNTFLIFVCLFVCCLTSRLRLFLLQGSHWPMKVCEIKANARHLIRYTEDLFSPQIHAGPSFWCDDENWPRSRFLQYRLPP